MKQFKKQADAFKYADDVNRKENGGSEKTKFYWEEQRRKKAEFTNEFNRQEQSRTFQHAHLNSLCENQRDPRTTAVIGENGNSFDTVVFGTENIGKKDGNTYYSFVAGKYDEIWEELYAGKQNLSFYEIIREGEPCHLYFDLEFSRELNPKTEMNEFINQLLEFVHETFLNVFDINAKEIWKIVELDSSTEAKVSRHLIIKVPGYAFADNSHVKSFVHNILNKMRERIALEEEERDQFQFQVKSSKGEYIWIIDDSVYTRNRLFRTVFCRKAEKEAVFQPTCKFGFPGNDGTQMMSRKLIWLQSLVCNIIPEFCFLLQMPDVGKHNQPQKPEMKSRDDGCSSFRTTDGTQIEWTSDAIHDTKRTKWALGARKFFVELSQERAKQFQTQKTKVRRIVFMGTNGLTIFSMKGANFCQTIGRCHKSNQVYYMVDFYCGQFCQLCYDKECKKKECKVWEPLPPQIVNKELFQVPEVGMQQQEIGNDDRIVEPQQKKQRKL